MLDIIGIGKPVKDLLASIKAMPPEDGATYAEAFSSQGGGKVASAVVAAARLGMCCAIYANLGDDAKGRFCRDDFVRHGVDVSHLTLEEGKSSPYCLCIAESESQTRRFFGERGTSSMLAAEHLDFAFLRGTRLLHLENGDPASLAAAKFARESGITVAMDADMFYPQLMEMEPYVDLFIASAFYAKGRFPDNTPQEAAVQLAARGCRVAVITLGAQGCVGVADGKPFSLPAFTGLTVIDTTGAGDVFHGGFISAYLLGMSPVECARFASATSYIKCTRLGGRAGIPTRAMVEHFLATGELTGGEALDARAAFYNQLVT